MKCPKCNYVSYEWLDKCKNCLRDMTDFREKYGIWSIKPGPFDFLIIAQGDLREPTADQLLSIPQTSTKTELEDDREFSQAKEFTDEEEEAEVISLSSEDTSETEEEPSDITFDLDLDLPELESAETFSIENEQREEKSVDEEVEQLNIEPMEDLGISVDVVSDSSPEKEEELLHFELEDSLEEHRGIEENLEVAEDVPMQSVSKEGENLLDFELEDSLGEYSKIEDHLEAVEDLPLQTALDAATQHLGDDFAQALDVTEILKETDKKESALFEDLTDLETAEEKIRTDRPQRPSQKPDEDSSASEPIVELEDEMQTLDLSLTLNHSDSDDSRPDDSSMTTAEDSLPTEEEENEIPTFDLNLDDLNLDDLNLEDLEEPEGDIDSEQDSEEDKA